MMLMGFFRDLRHGYSSQPTLTESVGGFVDQSGEKTQIVAYLRAAEHVAVSGILAIDELSPQRTAIGTLSVQTDGVWAWPSDYAYYVATYDVAIPVEFIRSARARGWTPPRFTEADWPPIIDDFQASAQQANNPR